ncbi:MAG: IS1 family transposase [Chloroflexi bacterium]|nr:MAG: IS1 family transposase [Chloroflexota bacterium]
MATIEVKCTQCSTTNVVKIGKQRGHQQYKCKDCQKRFQLTYTYNAYKPEVREKVELMAHNCSGGRDTARVLGISLNTVVAYFIKSATSKSSQRSLICEDV